MFLVKLISSSSADFDPLVEKFVRWNLNNKERLFLSIQYVGSRDNYKKKLLYVNFKQAVWVILLSCLNI